MLPAMVRIRVADTGLLSTISRWLEYAAASQWEVTLVMSSLVLTASSVILLGVSSLEICLGHKYVLLNLSSGPGANFVT